MITVFFWAPEASRANVGHISMKIGVGQSKGLETYVSWWPNTRAEGGFLKDPVSPYTYEQDIGPNGEGKPPTASVSISGLNEAAMKRAWANMLAKKPGYFLLRKNCAWAVKSLLDVGTGYDLAAMMTDFGNVRIAGGVWTPRAVFEYSRLLKRRYDGRAKVASGSGSGSVDPYCLRLG